LLIRAAGPALGAHGVSGTLSDPLLALFQGATKIGENNDWGGTTELSSAFAQVGAFAYGALNSKDAAIFRSGATALPPGNYTLQVSAAGGDPGNVLAELYDATPAGTSTAATARLVNVSVLKQIGAGAMLTAGFVIGGSGDRTVLIRAVGPALADAPFKLSGTMADPKLDLFSGQTVINANDDWGGGAALSTAFANVGAFALGGASKDAALLVTLAPGSYTVQVSPVGGIGGLTLVEVYEVP
jgi:hypothetical protein